MKINTDPLNMDALGFDGYICGIRNIVIRNSEQQKPVVNRGMNFVRLNRQTAETQSQADEWYTCDQWLAVVQRRHGQEILLGLPTCSTSSRPQMSCRIPLCSRVICSVGNELLIVLLAS